jgi:glycosyltransferase involved in cell wall biosynthesis
MRLLLINYEMDEDSSALPHQAKIASQLATHVDQLTVLTEKIGRYDKIANMRVECMPHWPWGVPRRLGGGWLINFQLDKLIRETKPDVVFIHMAHRWAFRFWPVFKWHGLKVLFWYAHGNVDWSLKLATWAADHAISSSAEGFRYQTPKLSLIGQAIDTNTFSYTDQKRSPEILYWGRISQRKRILETVEAFAALCELSPGIDWRLKLVGPALVAEDFPYQQKVKSLVKALALQERVVFEGSKTQQQIAKDVSRAAVAINLSETGSMDKTTLEALATGTPVLTSNVSFRELLAQQPLMYSEDITPKVLGQRMLGLYESPPPAEELCALIEGQHDQTSYAKKVANILCDLMVVSKRQ